MILKILLKNGNFYKMIRKIKNIIKKSNIYKIINFWKDISFKDFLNFEKVFLFQKVYPYTMVGYQRLSNVYDLAKKAEQEKLEGVFAECGVWKGGCAAVMGFVAQKTGFGRKIWMFDSFEGLPEPTEKDGKIAKDYASNKAGGNLKAIDKCVGPIEDVKKIFFEKLRLDENNIIIKKGWFQDTLPESKEKIGKIALLRLDGDWYESTKVCLDNLYDDVIIGGYIILDDYGHWEGARRALDEFFTERKIKPELIKIDYTGVYFIKP